MNPPASGDRVLDSSSCPNSRTWSREQKWSKDTKTRSAQLTQSVQCGCGDLSIFFWPETHRAAHDTEKDLNWEKWTYVSVPLAEVVRGRNNKETPKSNTTTAPQGLCCFVLSFSFNTSHGCAEYLTWNPHESSRSSFYLCPACRCFIFNHLLYFSNFSSE